MRADREGCKQGEWPISPRVGVNLLVRNIAEEPNQLRATQFAVESLLASDLRHTNWRLQIVDDASPCDATQRYLRDLQDLAIPGKIYSWRSERQLGIAKGRNRGNRWFAERWQPDYVVEIHTDHIFPREWLRPMLAAMEEDPALGMVGPLLLTGRPMGWSLECVEVDFAGAYMLARAAVEQAAARHRAEEPVRFGMTHPAVKRWTMLQALAGYDEGLPGLQNYEDTEEAYRATRAGWRVGVCPASVVWHWYAFSRTRTTTDHHAHYNANRRYCEQKHGPEFERWCAELGQAMDAIYEERKCENLPARV